MSDDQIDPFAVSAANATPTGPPTLPPLAEPEPGPTGAAAWPWTYALLAFFGGFVASALVVLVIQLIWIGLGGKTEDNSSFTIVASVANEFVFVGAAWVVASLSGGVSLRDFGLLRAPFWPTVGKMALILVGYFILLAIYNQAVHLAPDDAPDKLGANTGTLGMLMFAILVAVIAPIAEEFFFRGMLFRALANGIGIWGGAIASGLLFGAMHIDSFSSDRLLQVVPLTVLGVLFALLYAWSGTLYATIALHATNNALAVVSFADKQNSTFGIVLAAVLWLGMMFVCGYGWRFTDREPKRDLGNYPPPSAPMASPERPVPFG